MWNDKIHTKKSNYWFSIVGMCNHFVKEIYNFAMSKFNYVNIYAKDEFKIKKKNILHHLKQ